MYCSNKYILYCLNNIFVSIYNGISNGTTQITHLIPCMLQERITLFLGEEFIYHSALRQEFDIVTTSCKNIIYTRLSWDTYGDI